MTNGGATKKKEDLGGKCLTLKTLTSLELNSTKRFEQNIFSFGIILYTTIKITGKFWSLQVFMAIMLKGWVTLPNQMNFKEKVLTAFDPPPLIFGKLYCKYFMIDMVAYLWRGMMAI